MDYKRLLEQPNTNWFFNATFTNPCEVIRAQVNANKYLIGEPYKYLRPECGNCAKLSKDMTMLACCEGKIYYTFTYSNMIFVPSDDAHRFRGNILELFLRIIYSDIMPNDILRSRNNSNFSELFELYAFVCSLQTEISFEILDTVSLWCDAIDVPDVEYTKFIIPKSHVNRNTNNKIFAACYRGSHHIVANVNGNNYLINKICDWQAAYINIFNKLQKKCDRGVNKELYKIMSLTTSPSILGRKPTKSATIRGFDIEKKQILVEFDAENTLVFDVETVDSIFREHKKINGPSMGKINIEMMTPTFQQQFISFGFEYDNIVYEFTNRTNINTLYDYGVASKTLKFQVDPNLIEYAKIIEKEVDNMKPIKYCDADIKTGENCAYVLDGDSSFVIPFDEELCRILGVKHEKRDKIISISSWQVGLRHGTKWLFAVAFNRTYAILHLNSSNVHSVYCWVHSQY